MDHSFGWPKKLRKTDEFSSVFHFRCTRRGRILDISAGPNALDHARLGMIVPKKVLSRAVDRNRLKRLLREWFRLHQCQLTGLDIIARLRTQGGPGGLDENVLKEDFFAGLAACQTCINRRQSVSNAID
jgi:ribonuclease P protein component